MKYLKLFDVLGQALVTIYLLLVCTLNDRFFHWLLIMGGWQVLSCLVHFFTIRYADRNESRRGYEVTLLIIVSIAVPLFPLLFILLLYLGPAMVIWYWLICLYETSYLFFWRRRPLDLIR